MKNLPILTVLFLSIAFAQPGPDVPTKMSFQGFLTDSEGDAYVDGEYNLIFRIIFSNPQGTDINIWEETQSIYVENGLFSTILGTATELPPAIPSNAELEIQVGEDVLSPRTPFTSVPFSIKSNTAGLSNRAIMADSSMYSHYSDSSLFSWQSQHALFTDTAIVALSAPMAGSAMYATYSDTSMFAGNAGQSFHATYSDTSMFAGNVGHAQHATYADTSMFAGNVGHAQHATYADTAMIVDLSSYNGNINVQGSVNASSFVGDGSGLTGINGGGDESGIGARYMEIIFNVPALTNEYGDELPIVMDLDSALGINKEWFQLEAIRVVELNENHLEADLQLFGYCQWSEFSADKHSNCRPQSVSIKSEGYGYISLSNGPFFTYSLDGHHTINIAAQGNDVTGCKILFKVTSDW